MDVMDIIVYSTAAFLAGFAVVLAVCMYRGGKRADRIY